MMHVAVPTTRTVAECSHRQHNVSPYYKSMITLLLRGYEILRTVFNVFDIHINGAYQCTLRYSELLKLHQLIQENAIAADVPKFPPKYYLPFFPVRKLEERRELLQDYLRSIFQCPNLSSCLPVQQFFLEAQKNSCLREKHMREVLPVYLLDGLKIDVTCRYGECTSTVLKRIAEAVNMSPKWVNHFGLFIVTKSSNLPYKVVRWLKDFECPLLSLRSYPEDAAKKRVVVRKCFWHSPVKQDLLYDEGCLRIMFAEAVAELRFWKLSEGQMSFGSESATWGQIDVQLVNQIYGRCSEVLKAEFIRLCEKLPFCGYMFFENCTSDYPDSGTTVHVAVGRKRLVLLYRNGTPAEVRELVLKVTRIRSWQLSVISVQENQDLALEYLSDNNCMIWIKLCGKQCVLISLCLQSLIDELLQRRLGAHELSSANATVPSGSPDALSARNCGDFTFFNPRSSVELKSIPVTNHAFSLITDDDL